jgi:hypothetical protein
LTYVLAGILKSVNPFVVVAINTVVAAADAFAAMSVVVAFGLVELPISRGRVAPEAETKYASRVRTVVITGGDLNEHVVDA